MAPLRDSVQEQRLLRFGNFEANLRTLELRKFGLRLNLQQRSQHLKGLALKVQSQAKFAQFKCSQVGFKISEAQQALLLHRIAQWCHDKLKFLSAAENTKTLDGQLPIFCNNCWNWGSERRPSKREFTLS